MPAVLAGVGVEDRDAPVAVAVGDVDLVGLRIDVDLGRLSEIGEVVAPLALALRADLQQEPAVPGELENLRVVAAAARQPDVVQVVDEDAVLRLRPLVVVGRAAPGLDDVALLGELDDRRGRAAALGERRVGVGAPLLLVEAAGPVDDPDVVARVDRHAHHVAQGPVVRERLGPVRIEGEAGPAQHAVAGLGGDTGGRGAARGRRHDGERRAERTEQKSVSESSIGHGLPHCCRPSRWARDAAAFIGGA